MSSFFRDSHLFASRSSKPLFGASDTGGADTTGKQPSALALSFDRYKSKDKGSNGVIGNTFVSSTNKLFEEDEHVGDTTIDEVETENDFDGGNYSDDNVADEEDKGDQARNNDTGTDVPTDDDEIEITDVREISGNVGTSKVSGEDLDTSMSDNSMDNSNHENTTNDTIVSQVKTEDDKSMEYLLNTIAHLNDRNSKLQNQLSVFSKQNKSLNEKLVGKTEVVDHMKSQLGKFKNTIKVTGAQFQDLKKDFAIHTKKSTLILEDLANTKTNLTKQHEVIASLKNLVTKIKTEITTNEITLNQKHVLIDNLKSKNDDLAGRLSEQKLKNSSLNKIIVEKTTAYETSLQNLQEKYNLFIENNELDKKVYLEKWNLLVANFEERFGESKKHTQTSVETITSCLNDNFNDVALRLTGLNKTVDLVQTGLVEQTNNVGTVKSDIIGALSDVDKSIESKIHESTEVNTKRIAGLGSFDDLKKEIGNLFCVVNDISEKEKEVKVLREERDKLVKSNLSAQSELKLIVQENNFKAEESTKLEKQLSDLKDKKNEIIEGKESNIKLLQQEIINLNISLQETKSTNKDKINKLESEIQNLNETSKKVELQNIKAFNDEKRKNSQLNEELLTLTQNCTQKVALYEDQLKQYETCTKKIIELENQLNIYRNDDSSNQEIIKLNKKIEIFKDNVTEKQKLVESLRNTIFENDKTINELKEQIKLMNISSKGPTTIKDIFTKSRTSTVAKKEPLVIKQVVESNINTAPVKQEPLSQIRNESIKPVKKPRAKRAKQVSAIKPESTKINKSAPKVKRPEMPKTSLNNSKRKLLDSSQDSMKSQTLQKKKTEAVKKSILDDLDIFNEFVAMDRMETIGKPGW